MEILFLLLTFKRKTKLSVISSRNHDSNLAYVWLKSFSGMIIICNRAGFARFGKISGRVLSNHGLYFGETKQALIISRIGLKPTWLHIYHPDQKWYFWKQKSLYLRNFMIILNARTYQVPALGDRTPSNDTCRYGREFCSECVCRLVFSHVNFVWSDTMIPLTLIEI